MRPIRSLAHNYSMHSKPRLQVPSSPFYRLLRRASRPFATLRSSILQTLVNSVLFHFTEFFSFFLLIFLRNLNNFPRINSMRLTVFKINDSRGIRNVTKWRVNLWSWIPNGNLTFAREKARQRVALNSETTRRAYQFFVHLPGRVKLKE